jgi:hypothetical protein
MIAAVKGCHAVLSALLFLILPAAEAAEDLHGAARELARKTAVFGKVDPAAVLWRNVSSLGSAELAQARGAFEAALQEAGSRNGAAPSLAVHITLSQNPAQYMLVEEVQAGDEREVWIAAWKRTDAARNSAPGMSLLSKLVWEQDEPILDVAFLGDAMLVLSPSKVTLRARSASQSADLTPLKPWPRDLRGHLRVSAGAFQAFLPGMTCAGTAAPALQMECHAGDEPWVLESGSRGILLANFAAGRNFFDGRVVTQTGLRKTIAPFFSAAAVEEQGRTSWVVTMLDGRAQIFDSAFDPQGSFATWGSDIAAVDAHCGAGSQIVAARRDDGSEPDAVQAFALANGTAVPLTAPITFAGPVTAIWPSGATSVVVARDLSTGKYGAYVISVACGS